MPSDDTSKAAARERPWFQELESGEGLASELDPALRLLHGEALVDVAAESAHRVREAERERVKREKAARAAEEERRAAAAGRQRQRQAQAKAAK